MAAILVAVMVLVFPIKISPKFDLMQRGAAPALFILVVIISRNVVRYPMRSRARPSLVALLAVGSLTPGVAVVRALTTDARLA